MLLFINSQYTYFINHESESFDINNLTIIIQTVGGLGLFLLGMVIMTDSLRSLAGRSVRTAILKFTRTPTSGAITGAVGTAILQSSSATTVAAIGFVGAGLMAFPEALGVVFGANIGTTLKGWVIAIFGFKYDLGTMALPVIFFGVVLRLFSTGKWSAIGYACAGFGLVFVAINTMQTGMSGLEGVLTPDVLPADTWWGRIQLVLLGILITVITQSSSAGVAAALTAVYLGTINFHQAAAMVIGMDVGTTVTALLATLGASSSARRTGLSHVIFNLFTGVGAVLLITPFVWTWENWIAGDIVKNAEIALVAFHTTFNLLGVLIILPVTRQFAAFMERLVPDRYPIFIHDLSALILREPAAALNEIQIVIGRQYYSLLAHIVSVIQNERPGHRINLREMQSAIDSVHTNIDKIHLDEKDTRWGRLVELIHTLDHMQRLHERCEEEEYRNTLERNRVELSAQSQLFLESVLKQLADIKAEHWVDVAANAAELHQKLDATYSGFRNEVMTRVGRGQLNFYQANELLEGLRWYRRVSRHLTQISKHYLTAIGVSSPATKTA